MSAACIFILAAMLLASASVVRAGDAGACPREEVLAHVRAQFAAYGPRSSQHEYFGYIYLHQGAVSSAVTRSGKCRQGNCLVDTRAAAEQIPRGAKVLGEWHTHPHDGSTALSAEDVRGAGNNRHIRCYSAFYSKPNGQILSWEPAATSVPSAMASRVTVGNYTEQVAANIDGEASREN